MNHPLELRLEKAAFYRWVVAQEGRYELENGRVQQMTGATKVHARIVSNFVGELRQRLDLDAWSVTACDVAVEIGDNVRYPDIVVERLDAPGAPLVAERACLLVEVLPPRRSAAICASRRGNT
jgi:Uma2 family endonuclease